MRARPLLSALAVTSALLLSAAPAVAADPTTAPTRAAAVLPTSLPTSVPTSLPTAIPTNFPGLPGLTPPSGTSPDIAAALTTFGTCLQTAGTDPVKGQDCFVNFFTALGLPQAQCFSSSSGLTLTALQTALQTALTKQNPSGLQQLGTDLQGALACLTKMPSATPTTSTGGGGASTESPVASTGTAPAATPVAGTPTFTG